MPSDPPSVEPRKRNEILRVEDLRAIAVDAGDHFHSFCWFRGQAAADWSLQPHIFRENAPTEYEGEMLDFFKQEAPAQYDRCPGESDKFGWLRAYLKNT